MSWGRLSLTPGSHFLVIAPHVMTGRAELNSHVMNFLSVHFAENPNVPVLPVRIQTGITLYCCEAQICVRQERKNVSGFCLTG